MNTESLIKSYISKNLLYSEGEFPYSDDASFLKEGIIDSLGVMELVEFVQKELGVPVEQSEVTPQHFDSVAKLAAFVRTKNPSL